MTDPHLAAVRAWGKALRAQKLARCQSRRRCCFGFGALALILGLTILFPPRPRLIWNASASAPVGLYRVVPGAHLVRGDMVIAWAPYPARLLAAPRQFYGRTSISAGIDLAMKALNQSGLEATRRVIDVCGDGTNNSGREITEARDDALRQGVVINGLTIINDHPVSYTFAHVAPPGGLTNWYRENVVGGPGGFVLEVHDFHSFGEAMTRKLISEIAALRAQPGPG